MTSTYLFYLFEIIGLNTFLEFLSFIYMISKLNILSNHAKHPKGLVSYYMPPFFILVLLYLNFNIIYLSLLAKKMLDLVVYLFTKVDFF